MLWLVLFAIFWLSAASAWADGAVHVVLSESEAAYEEAAAAFQDALGTGRNVRVWHVRDLSQEQVRRLSLEENLIVPVGLKATRFVAYHHAGRGNVLGLMVPKVSAESIPWPGGWGPGGWPSSISTSRWSAAWPCWRPCYRRRTASA